VSGRKPTAGKGICECHGKPSAECPRNRTHVVTATERALATAAWLAGPHEVVELGPEWLMCRCSDGDQPGHPAHQDDMGRFDFDYGYNVKPVQGDVPTYELPTCVWCGLQHDGGPDKCKEAENQTEENNNMIPRGQPQQDQQGNNRGKRKGSGLRYLSADMLSATHQAATINDARVENDTFRQGTVVTVKLKFKGEFILWTLRPGNPNLETLGDALGDDETSWHGHDIEVYVEEDNFNGKKWIRSEVVVSNPTPAPPAKRR
jgi:hypothetical protein